MRYTLFLLLFLSFDIVYSQEYPFNKYYLGDSVIKKNKVKSSIYTDISFPHLNTISEFDEMGRETVWYYTKNNTKNHSKFLHHQDTLLSIHFTSTNDTINSPHEVSKYVYDKKGNITFYAMCRRSINDKSEADFTRFYYDEKGKLTSALYFSSYNYPFPINEYFPIIESLFKLTNVESFQYGKNLQLTAIKQMIGNKNERYVDSFYYDKQKRLIKRVRHEQEGFVGEMRQQNIFYITEYFYSDTSIIEKKTTQYEDVFGKSERDVDMEYEAVKQKNGLTYKTYWIRNNKKEMSATYDYNYY